MSWSKGSRTHVEKQAEEKKTASCERTGCSHGQTEVNGTNDEGDDNRCPVTSIDAKLVLELEESLTLGDRDHLRDEGDSVGRLLADSAVPT